jgi:anti-sigma factor RsiW
MTHEEARTRLAAFLDGALPDHEAVQVEAHLEGCSSCREELAQLRTTVTLLQEVEPMQAPEGFAAEVRRRIERLAQATQHSPWTRLRAALSWRSGSGPGIRWSWRTAAAAAAVVMVGVFTVNLLREAAPPGGVALVKMPALTLDVSKVGEDARTSAQAVPPGAVPGEAAFLRRVIRTGQMAIEVERYDAAASRLFAIAEGAGGFVADSSFSEEDGVPRGTFVLRVPAARFSEVVAQVEKLGTVQRRQISGQDVTEEFIDLEARVRNLTRQEARLLALMDRATKIPDLLVIEGEVARVRGEIERLTGRLRFLANKVDLATVQAEVSQKPKKASGGFWDFKRTLERVRAAFLSTVRQMLGAAESLAALAAALLPVALLGVVVWWLLRRGSRRADRVP